MMVVFFPFVFGTEITLTAAQCFVLWNQKLAVSGFGGVWLTLNNWCQNRCRSFKYSAFRRLFEQIADVRHEKFYTIQHSSTTHASLCSLASNPGVAFLPQKQKIERSNFYSKTLLRWFGTYCGTTPPFMLISAPNNNVGLRWPIRQKYWPFWTPWWGITLRSSAQECFIRKNIYTNTYTPTQRYKSILTYW